MAGPRLALLVLVPLLLGRAAGAADADRRCREAVATRAARALAEGLRRLDRCQAGGRGPCTPTAPSLVAGPLRSLAQRCPQTDPSLWQSPGPAAMLALDLDDSEAAGRGGSAMAGDRAAARCRAAVGGARTLVATRVMRSAIRCQRALDRRGGSGGELSEQCLTSSGPETEPAARLVSRACGGTTGAAAGSCDPLPGCVVDAATRTGRVAVASAYAYPGPAATVTSFALREPFTPATFYDFPYPSDLRLRPDGAPDVAAYPVTDRSAFAASLRGLRDIAQRRPGFPAVATTYFRFTGPLAPRAADALIPADPAAPILLVNVDDAPSALRGRLYPVVAQTPPADAWVPEHLLAVGPMPSTCGAA